MNHPESEEDLVAIACRGDNIALGKLLFQNYDRLAAHLAPKIPTDVKRTVSVDDIIQQTFACAFRDIQRFEYRGIDSLFAWLRKIADGRYQDAIKALNRQKRGGGVKIIGEAAESSFANLLDLIEGDATTPSRKLRTAEAIHALHVAIAELPEDYREVVRLRFLEGMSLEETAKKMNRSTASVRALTDRAKKKLRELFGELSAYLTR